MRMQGNNLNHLSSIKTNCGAGAEPGAEATMVQKSCNKEAGFTFQEIAVVVLLVGIVIAFAAPKITNAMREYRLDVGIRQTVDAFKRAKSQAVANNRISSLVADTANNRIGLLVFDDAGDVVRTDFVSLPDDIVFALPPEVVAPMTGAPTSSSVSFPLQEESTSLHQQDFTTRGFPDVATPNAINAVYLSNGISYRAVTINSYGGIRTWWWRDGAWTDLSD